MPKKRKAQRNKATGLDENVLIGGRRISPLGKWRWEQAFKKVRNRKLRVFLAPARNDGLSIARAVILAGASRASSQLKGV